MNSIVILLAPQLFGVHGIARYIQSFLSHVSADTNVVVLCGEANSIGMTFPANVSFSTFEVPSGRLGLVRWSRWARAQVNAMSKSHTVRSVNLHLPPLIPGLFVPKRAPIVLTVHTTYLGMSGQFYHERHFDSQWSALSVFAKKLMERFIFAKASSVIVLTEQGRQEVEQYGANLPSTTIPNGVDLSLFKRSTGNIDYDFIFAGRIEKRKGSRPMVEVCKALIAEKNDVRICIAGYGDDQDHVAAALADHSDNVALLGKVSFADMVEVMSRSAVYLSTSYYEGLPGTCLEAMALGLPAVTWDFPFYHGLVIEDVTGAVAKPNDAQALAHKAISLLKDSERLNAAGAAAHSLIAMRYNWDSLAVRIAKALNRPGGAPAVTSQEQADA